MQKLINSSADKKLKNNFIFFAISFLSMTLAFVSGRILVPSNIALPAMLNDTYTYPVMVVSFILSFYLSLNNKGSKVDKPLVKFCINYFILTLCFGIGMYGAYFLLNLTGLSPVN